MLIRGNHLGAWIKRMDSVICTGMPGLYRMISFFAIQHVYSLSDLGRIASNLAVAQMAGFFSAIGWATLILIRIPAAQTREEAANEFYNVLWMSLFTTLSISIAMAGIWAVGRVEFDVTGMLELLWGWTIYQVCRHYFVAQARYRSAILFDIVLTIGSLFAVYSGKQNGLTPSDALAIVLGGVAMLMIAVIGGPRGGFLPARFELKGLEFGMSNFVSGGVTIVFAPLAALLCGPAFAGVFSLLSSVSAIGALLPRSISLNQLPILSKLRASGQSLRRPVEQMRQAINAANMLVLVLNLAVSVALVFRKINSGPERDMLLMVSVLLGILSMLSSSGVTHANILMVFERSRLGLSINMKTTLVFCLGCVVAVWTRQSTSFVLLLLMASLLTLMKNMLLVRAASHEISKYALRSQLRCE